MVGVCAWTGVVRCIHCIGIGGAGDFECVEGVCGLSGGCECLKGKRYVRWERRGGGGWRGSVWGVCSCVDELGEKLPRAKINGIQYYCKFIVQTRILLYSICTLTALTNPNSFLLQQKLHVLFCVRLDPNGSRTKVYNFSPKIYFVKIKKNQFFMQRNQKI